MMCGGGGGGGGGVCGVWCVVVWCVSGQSTLE